MSRSLEVSDSSGSISVLEQPAAACSDVVAAPTDESSASPGVDILSSEREMVRSRSESRFCSLMTEPKLSLFAAGIEPHGELGDAI